MYLSGKFYNIDHWRGYHVVEPYIGERPTSDFNPKLYSLSPSIDIQFTYGKSISRTTHANSLPLKDKAILIWKVQHNSNRHFQSQYW